MANWKGFFGSLFGRSQGKTGAENPAVSAPGLLEDRRPKPKRRRPAAPVVQRAGELYRPGDVIGGEYEIRGKLGEGGFGVVYLAYSGQLKELVALKTFRDELLADAAARHGFRKEALFWVGVEQHPCVLAARWVTEISGRLFVAMDYIVPDEQRRVSLQDHLAHTNGPLTLEQTLRWGVLCCHGMEHVAAHGINCHRDIKPDNILIASDGTPKVADFGLAAAAEEVWTGRRLLVSGVRKVRPGYSLLMTEGRKVCGTPGYIAPEVYEGKGADIRSDIYSFGIVLWQMAAGSAVAPFVDTLYRGDPLKYQQGVYERIRAGDLPSVDGPLQEVIKRCLAYDRLRRWQNFAELRAKFEALYRSKMGGAPPFPKLPDKTATFWVNKGVSLYSLERYEEAIRSYDQALKMEPRRGEAWINRALSLAALGRYEETIDCLDRALEIDSKDVYVWTTRGNSLNCLGQHEKAIRCFEKALGIDPQFTYAWLNMGISFNSRGEREQAISCYDRVLKVDSRCAEAWNNKGNALERLGQDEEAIGCYDHALKINPWFPETWNGKGVGLSKLKRYVEAIDCFEEALKIRSGYVDAWINKGDTLKWLGQHAKAISCFEKALAIDRKCMSTWYFKALCEEEMGHLKSAISSWREYLDLAADEPSQAHWVEEAQRHLRELEERQG